MLRTSLFVTVLLQLFLGGLIFPVSGFAFDHSHKEWTKVLAEYQLEDGRVRYKKLQEDFKKDSKHPLAGYLKALSAVSDKTYSSWKRPEQMAFLINAYNAFTVKLIIDHYPVSGIKKTVGWLGNPWKKEFFSLLGGSIKTLDPIEHEWLRPKFNDARVHAAVNCASISCPVLQHEAFVGAKLEKQLEKAFTDFLADSSRNRYDVKEGVLYVSKIFDWFEEDFTKSYGSVAKTFEKLGPEEARAALKKKGSIEYLDYDWNLNDAPAETASVVKRKS